MARKANYASEMELKSLLIRAKNSALGMQDLSWNRRINELVTLFIASESWRQQARVLKFRKNLRAHIVWACERCAAGEPELTRLCNIVDLMIDRILTKPQFSGYTYTDEFHSDAQFKIFRYITNFDHKKISRISGDFVNAFAYVTQIIHNSIIYVISTNKKHRERIKTEYLRQQIAFSVDNPGFRVPLKRDAPVAFEVSKMNVTKYYRTKANFVDNFETDLERVDFDKVDKLIVYVPRGCDVSNFTNYDITFKELI